MSGTCAIATVEGNLWPKLSHTVRAQRGWLTQPPLLASVGLTVPCGRERSPYSCGDSPSYNVPEWAVNSTEVHYNRPLPLSGGRCPEAVMLLPCLQTVRECRTVAVVVAGKAIQHFVDTPRATRQFRDDRTSRLTAGGKEVTHELRGQDNSLCGLWQRVHVHRGRTAVFRGERFHK